MILRIMAAVPLFLCLASAQNLLVNGDFEQDISVGWSQLQGGAGTHTTQRQTNRHPDPDYEAWVRQYSGSGWTKLYQMVDIPGPDVLVNFWASFNIGGGSSTCWPVAAVFIEYYNQSGLYMGDTRFCYHNAYWNWTQTGTRSLIDVASPDWMAYGIHVRQEVDDNLPSVNSEDIRKLSVALYSYTSGG